MKVGIIQSNYIPWRGYFDFIDDVDLFVLYDDVPFGNGKKWRNRNKIKIPNGTKWLTVPLTGRRGERCIDQVEIDYSQPWQKKHLGALFEYYRKAPFYKQYIGEFSAIIQEGHTTISELNLALYRWIMEILNIKTELKMSREYTIPPCSKIDRPLLFLEKIGATSYVLGAVAKPYTDVDAFKQRGIALEYKSYDYAQYPQQHGDFIGEVSVLDLVFNLGSDAREHLKSKKPNEVAVL